MKLSCTQNGLPLRVASDQTSLRAGGPEQADLVATRNSASLYLGPVLFKALMPNSTRLGGFTAKRAQEITAQLQPSGLIGLVAVNARVFGRAGQFLKAAGSLSHPASTDPQFSASGTVHALRGGALRARLLALVEKKPDKPD